ncbi:MAG: hypothetical protein LQ342_001769 [Letrouitia transgressa]|nr:MAG: hypothetical protein LQ342_001769 [Letrouitia transgressa]
MAYRFESPDLVLDLLRRLSTSGSDMENFRIQRTCIKILRNHSDDPDWYKTTLNYQAQMLEIGIRPQQIMLNAMIMNAVEAEDFETAYSIFDVAKSRRIRRGTVMYSVIFKGVAQSLNHNILEGLILRAEEEGALPRNNPLVFCLLVTVWKLLHRGRKLGSQYPQVYTAMLQVYARYCDVFPLQELGIYMPEKSKRVEPISKPTPQILCIMLLGFMAQHSNSNHLLDLYMRYHSLVKQNHPLITPIAQTDHVANAFVLHLGRNIRTLSACPMILRNMLEPPVTANIKVAEPSVQTWSILAFSYSIQGQKSAAERVLAMMRERGYRPNGVTWNSIINGYAKCQDIKAVVEAMRQMTSAGFEVNSRILRALTHVVDQKGLLSSLRKVINIDQIYEREFDPKDKQSELVTSKVLGNGSEVIQYAVKKKQRQIRDNEATIKLQEGAYD